MQQPERTQRRSAFATDESSKLCGGLSQFHDRITNALIPEVCTAEALEAHIVCMMSPTAKAKARCS